MSRCHSPISVGIAPEKRLLEMSNSFSGISAQPPNTCLYMHAPLIMMRRSSPSPSSPSCDGSVPDIELPLITKRFIHCSPANCEGSVPEMRLSVRSKSSVRPSARLAHDAAGSVPDSAFHGSSTRVIRAIRQSSPSMSLSHGFQQPTP